MAIQQAAGVELAARLHDAYNRRDREALLACLADDVVWHVEGDNPAAGVYEGRERVWDEVFEPLWASPARVQDDELLEHGEHVIALQRALHNFGDGERSWRAVEIMRIAGGRVAARWEFTSDRASLDAMLQRGCAAAPDVF
ncbi:MAG TPA: nuclear transport factor 2 family protein [Candidatus Dormibacteraeota bacterium]